MWQAVRGEPISFLRSLLQPDLGYKVGDFIRFWDSPGNFLISKKSEKKQLRECRLYGIPTQLFLEVGSFCNWSSIVPRQLRTPSHPNPIQRTASNARKCCR